MKRIMIVGAGIGQYYLARKIKEKGYYLITVTLPGNQPVISIADKVCYHDVFDKEGVLDLAREEKIDAIVSDQNDTMMPTVAFVAEHLGLPGNNSSMINAYCNKNVFRDTCDQLNIPVPRHCAVNRIDIPGDMKDVPFPWVVKPADSQSSIGVARVTSTKEFFGALSNAIYYSKTKTAIVEEYFEGQELVAEGFIYRGKYYNLGFADRKYFALEGKFIPSQTIFPSLVPQVVLGKIEMCESKMAAKIKPSFAIVHSEYLYNPASGQFCVVESALRGGGVYISSHIIPLYCNIDINDVLIDCCLGRDVDFDSVFSKRKCRAAGYFCFYLPEGTISRVEGFDIANQLSFVKMVCLNNVSIGQTTSPLTHKGQRLGPIIVIGSDRKDIENNISSLQKILKVEVVGKDGKKCGINWN